MIYFLKDNFFHLEHDCSLLQFCCSLFLSIRAKAAVFAGSHFVIVSFFLWFILELWVFTDSAPKPSFTKPQQVAFRIDTNLFLRSLWKKHSNAPKRLRLKAWWAIYFRDMLCFTVFYEGTQPILNKYLNL